MTKIENTLESIAENAKYPYEFIDECEKKYNNKILNIANIIKESSVNEIVMLAGPSSAGKTTTAKKLSEVLSSMDIPCHTISLDDFYLNNCDAPRFPDGTADFETVEALDIEYFKETIRELLEKRAADMPEFDFLTGMRRAEKKRLEIGEKDVIIVEGLHALNPIITSTIPKERLLKIYINLSSRIYDRNMNIVLNKRNMRFLRRLIRDYQFRGNSVEETFKMWISVRYGEDAYLFPYKDNADIKINTVHLYETCVLKDMAVKLLFEVEKNSEFYKESQRLIRSLLKFPEINSDYVPDSSLLREFIGKRAGG